MTATPATAAQAQAATARAARPGSPPRPGATLALTSAATAVALMTYTAPIVTLPATAAALHTPLSAQAWLLNGTPLGLAALLLVAGSLADDYGRRRIFVWGTLSLGITTALSALATDTWLFTLTRIAQGAASAALLASSLGLIVHAFPTAAGRLKATGVWGAFVTGGIAVGPLLAAGIPHWRAVYGVLGAAALVIALLGTRGLTESKSPRGGRPDFAGAATFGPALVSLVAALTLGRDGWLRAPVWLLLGAAVVLLAGFALVERRSATPMIDLSLLRHRGFLASSAGGLFTGLSVIGLFSFLPAVLQRVLGMSAMQTALLTLLWAGSPSPSRCRPAAWPGASRRASSSPSASRCTPSGWSRCWARSTRAPRRGSCPAFWSPVSAAACSTRRCRCSPSSRSRPRGPRWAPARSRPCGTSARAPASR